MTEKSDDAISVRLLIRKDEIYGMEEHKKELIKEILIGVAEVVLAIIIKRK